MFLAVTVGPGQSGPLGLLVISLLALAAFFLFRSMTKQIRKIPPSFDPPSKDPPEPNPRP